MSAECLGTISCRQLPYANRSISGSRDEVVVPWKEAYGADGVVVAMECLCVLPVIDGVPNLDGEVRGTRGEEIAARVEVDVLDGFCVSLERPLKLARLPVPNLDGGVF